MNCSSASNRRLLANGPPGENTGAERRLDFASNTVTGDSGPEFTMPITMLGAPSVTGTLAGAESPSRIAEPQHPVVQPVVLYKSADIITQ